MTASHSETFVIQSPGKRLRPGRLELLALVAIVLLALALRAYHLGTKSLWLDELNLLRSADGHGFLFRRFGYSILDHPPAYLFLLRVVMLTLGREEWMVRLPALIASVASIPALWMLGRTLFGPTVALMAALLLTVAPMHVAYGQEAHSYGLYCLLSILLLWALVRAAQAEVDSVTQTDDSDGAERRRRARWLPAWGLFIVLATLSLYVHYYAFYLVALSALIFPLFVLDIGGGRLASLWREPARRRMLVRLLAALAIVAVLYLPQIILGMGNSVTYAGDLSSALPNKSPAEAVGWAIRRMADTATSGPLTTLAFLVVAFTGLAWLLWKRRFLAGAFLLIVILPLPPSLWMAFQTGVEFNARRVIFILPVLMLVAAVGLLALVQLAGWLWRQTPATEPDTPRSAAQSHRVMAVAAMVLIAAVMVFSARSLTAYYRTPKQDWKGAGRVLAAHAQPADAVVAPPKTARNLTWYYPQVKPIEGNLPDELEALCRVKPRVYFAVMPSDSLPRESAQWISQHFVEVPLKNLSLYYRNCTMNSADWYGAGANELFELAYDPKLPYLATQRGGAQYQELAAQHSQDIVSETAAAVPEEPTPAMPATELDRPYGITRAWPTTCRVF